MNYELFIARRYLFSHKSHNAINIISGISVVGVAIATMALVCTLSVFNGFRDFIASLFTAFDPQLKVSLVEGRTIEADDSLLTALKNLDCVDVYTPVLEDHALVAREGRQIVVSIKGVDDNFLRQSDFEDILYGEGEPILHADNLEYGILGIQLASQLGLEASFPDPLQIYAPRKGERVNMANLSSSFTHDELQSPGVVFMVQQNEYDAHYILTSLGFAQRLFDQRGRVSSVELRLHDGVNLSKAKKQIRQLLGPRFEVKDRYEQQDDVFRIMRIEKFLSYLFLSFILLVACFNILGSLSMLMIDKKKDVETLRSLGADNNQICRIFMLEGRLISLMGALAGILIGLLLCWLQQTFGIIRMGDEAGSFIIDAYPVSIRSWDMVLILFTVIAVGWIAVWYPVRYLSKNLL